MTSEKKKALIAMSGGVDSSVAALLSMESGMDCVGVTMKLFENEDVFGGRGADGGDQTESCGDGAGAGCGSSGKGGGDQAGGCDIEGSRSCCSLKDADDASRVCGMLGIPFYVFDFTENFRRDVIERFNAEYAAGRTPNPCIDCNRYLKYERLIRRMESLGFDYVVTGHYARIKPGENGRLLLMKALDGSKDQSYVLYSLTQNQLAHTSFPLGELRKSEVRDIAESHGFVNARKRDSQDICFVPDGRYADFIESYAGRRWSGGNFVDTDGNVIGRHEGIIRYTIGQRKGLGRAFGKPVYVVDICPETNEVVLGADDELYTDTVHMRDVNLISVPSIENPMRVTAKIRYNQEDSPATATQTSADEVTLVFDEPQRAVTKGQAAVMYDGDIVVGGGTIVESIR